MDDSTPASSHVELNLKLEKHVEEDKVDKTLFKQIVGSLRYVCNIQPDIGFSVGSVRRYMSEPRVSNMKIARRILRYLKRSINYGILFPRDSESKEDEITFYLDVGWCGDEEDQRSTIGYFFQVFGAPISLCSRKQHVVALPSCEAEYIT
ncbi:secreted RxLR effector protein 161-like [Lathyrus oleraceus]|uniref:secreted RxLR effector protein 161-like n=1 Tax=Pisum sativum TaxID=3888 RepID=UPI0021CFBB9B|nr:secreted RxLR effector protein 161-like [Pisum sativum]